jgi:hypothetical protein
LSSCIEKKLLDDIIYILNECFTVIYPLLYNIYIIHTGIHANI